MDKYIKTVWEDHIVDDQTGAVIKQGTTFGKHKMNNIENGLESATNGVIDNSSDITSLAIEVAVLKNSSLNNLINNVFFENFDDLDSVVVENGIYNPVSKKIYV